MMMSSLSNRLPKVEEILPVYAVIAIYVYGQSLYIFSYKLPSWLTFLHTGEIFSILAYGLAVNLLESLLLLAALMAISFFLPTNWLTNAFVARGAAISSFVLGSVLLFIHRYSSSVTAVIDLLSPWLIATLILSVPVAYFAGRVSFLRIALENIADRLIILLFILIPASLISLVIVIIRNIF